MEGDQGAGELFELAAGDPDRDLVVIGGFEPEFVVDDLLFGVLEVGGELLVPFDQDSQQCGALDAQALRVDLLFGV